MPSRFAAASSARASSSLQIRKLRDERGPGAAEMAQQRGKGARADIVGPDQPQPVEALGFGDLFRLVDGVHVCSLWARQWSNLSARGRGAMPLVGLVPAIGVI
jgi:hypothetical protein